METRDGREVEIEVEQLSLEPSPEAPAAAVPATEEFLDDDWEETDLAESPGQSVAADLAKPQSK